MNHVQQLLKKNLLSALAISGVFILVYKFGKQFLEQDTLVYTVFFLLGIVLAVLHFYLSKSLIDEQCQMLKESVQSVINEQFDKEFKIESKDLFGDISRGISTLKDKVQRLIDEKNHAEMANKNKSKFLSHMSHEIRTPLTGIVGTVELLCNTDIDRNQFDYLDFIKSSSDHLMNLIKDILSYTKIEAGQIELDLHAFYLRKTIQQTVGLMQIKSKQQNVYVAAKIHPDVPEIIVSDETKIRQILFNLIGNALKFTREGGITVIINVESDRSVILLKCTVEDTGVGISKSKQERIFQEFKQADSSIEAIYGGTGLGLSITKQLVLLLGGRISVASEEGKGTRFTFTIKGKYPKPQETKRLEQNSLVFKG